MKTAQKLDFFSFAKIKDGNEYCTAVESVVDNMIEDNENDATVIYPAIDKYGTFRSKDYRITTDSLYILLPYPIYKLKSLKIKPNGLIIGGIPYEQFLNQEGESFIPDVTRFFVLNEEWNALRVNPSGDFGVFGWELAQSNTIPYSQKTKEIWISSNLSKRRPRQDELPVYSAMIVSAFLNEEVTSQYLDARGMTLYNALVGLSYKEDSLTPKDWTFQVEYIPISAKTKIKAEKESKTSLQSHEFTRVVNQRAEVTSAELYGKYLYAEAQKTGAGKIAVSKIYHDLADIPPVGAVVMHNGEKYRISANQWNISNPNTCTITHIMSKGWINKSNHISIDQKYRNWNIPFTDYIWRTVYYQEFIELSYEKNIEDSNSNYLKEYVEESMKASLRGADENYILSHLFVNRGNRADYKGVIVPLTTQAVGNSIVLSASMQDNLSAGFRVDPNDNEYCKDVLYCNETGELLFTRLILSNGIDNYNSNSFPESTDQENYPLKYKETNKHCFEEKFYLAKDPGEALKFVFQIHFMPIDENIIIGKEWTRSHPIIVNRYTRSHKLYGLKKPIRKGVDVVDEETLKDSISPFVSYPAFSTDGSYVEITDNSFIAKLKNENCVAWAILNNENKLYIGSNDISKLKIYFNWTRERSK